MARKERKKDDMDSGAWLATYSDMVTLILVFFILLFSMSSIDQEKYKLLVRAFTADRATLDLLAELEHEDQNDKADFEDATLEGAEEIDIEEIDDLNDLYVYLKNYVKENELEDAVQVEKGDDLVYVKFMSTLFFEPNRSVLKPGGRLILDEVGKALSQAEKSVKFVRIDGHTAEASVGNDTVNNRDLSTDRANVVLKHFESRYIHDPAKLFAVGYGLHRPLAPNDSEENRAQNRRVEILIGKKDPLQDELDKIYDIGR